MYDRPVGLGSTRSSVPVSPRDKRRLNDVNQREDDGEADSDQGSATDGSSAIVVDAGVPAGICQAAEEDDAKSEAEQLAT